MTIHHRMHAYSLCVRFLLAAFAFQLICGAKIIPRRDPLDGALDATVIAIMSHQSSDKFRVEDVFLGEVAKGQQLSLPGFKLAIDDTSTFVAGVERIEPIYPNTRILVFLKPALASVTVGKQLGEWAIAGFGNCYFWSHDPSQISSLRSTAIEALSLRQSWEAARDLPDERERVEALWPYLWNDNGRCYKQTEAALQKIGPVAGDYIAEQLDGMTYRQKDAFLNHFAIYRSPRLHAALIGELKKQEMAWEQLLLRHGRFETYDEISPPGRMRYNPRRPQDAEANTADDIYGVLYQGFVGLGSFNDRNDLTFTRESALWAVKNRFKQLDDAALDALAKLPDKENLPVIHAIWDEFSKNPFVGNALNPSLVTKALDANRVR